MASQSLALKVEPQIAFWAALGSDVSIDEASWSYFPVLLYC